MRLAITDVALVQHVFTYGKVDDEEKQKTQMMIAAEDCTTIIATKLLDLVKQTEGLSRKQFAIRYAAACPVMKQAMENVSDEKGFPFENSSTAQANSAVVELTPKVIRCNEEGRTITDVESIEARARVPRPAEMIPCHAWAKAQAFTGDDRRVQSLSDPGMSAVRGRYFHAENIPLVLNRRGEVIRAFLKEHVISLEV